MKSCDKCKMTEESEFFWDTHQTMPDYKIWCKQR